MALQHSQVKARIRKLQDPHLLKKQMPKDAAFKIVLPINLSVARPSIAP